MSVLPEEFDHWIAAYFEGELDPHSQSQFEDCLRTSEEARRIFCQSAATQSDVERILGRKDPDIPVQPKAFEMKSWFWAAAAALVLCLVVPFLFERSEPFEKLIAGEDTLAVAIPRTPGSYRALRDVSIEVEEGLKLGFSEATRFSLDERGEGERFSLHLEQGTLHLDISEPHPGVELQTPAGVLSDIGTSFNVEVEDVSQRVFAEVRDGKVEFSPSSNPEAVQILTPDQGRLELSDSTAIGHVTDREGNGTLRPFMGTRWSVARIGMPLEAKDWVRTGRRGAHALKVTFINGAELILGPDTLLELESTQALVVHHGEFQVKVPEGVELTVKGPEGVQWKVDGKTVVGRVQDRSLTRLENIPGWLSGYLNDESTEAMGSLMAKVDGRNLPLTMGYHKVTVDIRDQIARTVIEESFLNHTGTVLEGVFYFPLPADASISEFGMWIGDELVHGEIVEKQRAREIYETILREKRDPALLEWSGGNIFKARVFPIVGEKRIKIGYTQILPKTGDRYTYRYALQSDQFRQYPLEELALTVRVHSQTPLQHVFSPSHLCRTDRTEHSSLTEYRLQDAVPERDFVLHIDTESETDPLQVIPHRRADDGYFMMLLQPPAPGEDMTRPILPASSPMDVVVMVDTSGSSAGPAREAQLNFLEALLNGLGEKDRVQIMTFDTEVHWGSDMYLENTPENRREMLAAVENRIPLGWTDLDQAWTSLSERIQGPAQVIFVGDGVVTNGDVDAQAWITRFKKVPLEGITVHAVAPANQYDASVLQALASTGSGTWRRMETDDPSQTVQELLQEITTPSVKDLTLTFTGIEVAAVYPETLPHLPVGSQQRIVGRYNVSGGPAEGRVQVTGTFQGKQVSYTAAINLNTAEEGNSFIPRLWARQHLDMLLEQGRSPRIQEQVIGLSEDYQIITPYTSFLVLETDADRERFKVQKSFRMRDGEEFFAEGRAAANQDLRRQQMIRAKTWRKQLYQRLRNDLLYPNRPSYTVLPSLSPGYGKDQGIPLPILSGQVLNTTDFGTYTDAVLAGGNRFGDVFYFREDKGRTRDVNGTLISNQAYWYEYERGEDTKGFRTAQRETTVWFDQDGDESYRKSFVRLPASGRLFAQGLLDARWESTSGGTLGYIAGESVYGYFPSVPRVAPYHGFPQRTHTASPAVPAHWAAEIRELLTSVNRRTALQDPSASFLLHHSASYRNAQGKWIPQGATTLRTHGTDWWRDMQTVPGATTKREWVLGQEHGVLDPIWGLGRLRNIEDPPGVFPSPFQGYFGTYLAGMASMNASILPGQTRERVEIRFTSSQNADTHRIWRIDPSRNLLLEMVFLKKDTVTQRIVFSEPKPVGTIWWPQQIHTFNEKGEHVRREQIEIQRQPAEEGNRSLKELRTAIEPRSVLLNETLPSLVEAYQAVQEERETLEDVWVLFVHQLQIYRPEKADAYWKEMSVFLEGKPGQDRLELMMLQFLRRLHPYHRLLLKMAADLNRDPENPLAYSRAMSLLTLSQQVALSPGERKHLLEELEPLFRLPRELPLTMRPWYQAMQSVYDQMGQREEAFALIRLQAEHYPDLVGARLAYARRLAGRRKVDEALQVLQQALNEQERFSVYDRQQLHHTRVDLLWQNRRLPELIASVKGIPEAETTTAIWSIYLTALVADQQADLAREWMEARIQAVVQGDRSPAAQAAYQAAIQRILGNGYHHYTQRITQENAEMIKGLVLTLLLQQHSTELIDPLVTHYPFRNSSEAPALWQEMYRMLQQDLDSLPPNRVGELIRWLHNVGYQPDDHDEWAQLYDRLFVRWNRATGREKAGLESALMQYGSLELRLKIVRLLIQHANTPEHIRIEQAKLFDLLLQQAWSEEVLVETRELLQHLDESGSRNPSLRTQQWVQWVERSRFTHLQGQIEKLGAKSRREQQKIEEDLQEKNRRWMIDWLRGLEQDPPQDVFGRWFQLERAERQAQLKEFRQDLQNEGLRALSDALSVLPEEVPPAEGSWLNRWVNLVSRVAMNSEETAFTENVLLLLERADSREAYGRDWKQDLFRMLVVTDQGDRLEKTLHTWHHSDDYRLKMRWGRMYAMILAERNQIGRACEVFEFLGNHQMLHSSDYRTLSDWYLVLDERRKSEAAKHQSWKELQEHELRQWLNQKMYRHVYHQTAEAPEEFDPEIAEALDALFRKSMYPEQNLYLMREFYQRYRDFRLLTASVESVVGQSPQGIYQHLQAMQPILDLLQEEATLDQILKHIQSLEKQGLTKTDQRAMHLLTFMVSFRAATQAQGQGPHVEHCYQALNRAFRGEWAEGEAVLMAGLLSDWGPLSPEKLLEEQLRQLRALRASESPGSRDHLTLSGHLAAMLWGSGEREQAVQLLESSLHLRRQKNGGRLLVDEVQTLRSLSGYLISLSRFRKAEELWKEERQLGYPERIREEMKRDLYQVYASAFRKGGTVSIGSGTGVYPSLQTLYLAELREPKSDVTFVSHWVVALCNLWREGHRQEIGSVNQDSFRFAFSEFPKLLQRTGYLNAQDITSRIADCLYHLHGAVVYLEFLIVRAENEPQWMSELQYNFWYTHGGGMAQRRAEVRERLPASLADRLLLVVLEVLQEDMRSFQSRNRDIYWKHSSYFWKEQQEEFRRAALEILKEFPDSEAHIRYVVNYLRDGLRLRKEGTELLFNAYRRRGLSWEGRLELSQYLQEERRYEEARELLAVLLNEQPHRLDVHMRNLRCLHDAGDSEAAKKALQHADQYFRVPSRWGENAAHEFAKVTAYLNLYEKTVEYYEETIQLHVKTQPNRGVGNGTLSYYYEELAAVYQRMNQTRKAVDAIAGAIVSWGRNQDTRSHHLNRLDQILISAKDLETFVVEFEQEVAETGLDNAILRKALGKLYLSNGTFERSIHHLRQALLVQPDDAETRTYLLEAYSRAEKPVNAIQLLLETITRNPTELQAYQNLAERYTDMDNPNQAERAYTSMVEARPEESESHEALALVRERQNRWEAALMQWENVIRIRTQEPTGYLGKYRALMKLDRTREAARVRETLLETEWPEHFGDVKKEL